MTDSQTGLTMNAWFEDAHGEVVLLSDATDALQEAVTQARHAALAEVRRGVEGLEPGWHSDDWAGTGNYQVGFDAALSAVLRILDAAETP